MWSAYWTNFRANIWHPSPVRTSIMDGIQHPRDFFGIKDAIGSCECVDNPSWEESANFITLDTEVMISAESCQRGRSIEYRAVLLPYEEPIR